jgi:poly-gamma-glutamate capsule biosynthesis protein CapA/YwtB (metallophosphatase superfamily)
VKRVILILLSLALLIIGGGNKESTFAEEKKSDIPTTEIIEKEAIYVPDPSPAETLKPDLDVSSPIPVLEPTRVTVIAAGDLMCLYAQISAARKNGEYKFDYCFDKIRDKIYGADLAICNFETLVAEGYKYTGRSPSVGSPKMNAPESYLSAAVNCGFDVFINANNHIFDRKTDGLDKTINELNKYGVMHAGAYATGETKSPLIADVKEIKIAILSYTGHINGHPKNATMVDKYSEELVTADIAAVKAAEADYIIVYMHWGKENTHKVNKSQKKMAAFVANAGADIIIGSHPHCTQGIQNIETEHGTVPVFYSLGNLVSSMGRTINRDSTLVNIVLEKDIETGITTLAGLTYTPTRCSTTSAGRYVILPADLDSIAESDMAKALKSSRTRTVKVLKDEVAAPG